MMAKASGPITETTKVSVSLPIPAWASLIAVVIGFGVWAGILQQQANQALNAIHEHAVTDDEQNGRLSYHDAVMIAKGMMTPEQANHRN